MRQDKIANALTTVQTDSMVLVCLATQQGGSEMRTDDKAPTLTAAAGMSGNNQPVICFDPKWLSDSRQATSIMGDNAKDNPCVCYPKAPIQTDSKAFALRMRSGKDGGVKVL